MEIIFTGTGSGKTSLKRYHSSFLISDDKYNLLVDAGDGISRALLSSKISFSAIDGILISHLHPDHYTGLAALLVQMKLTGRVKPLKIYAHKSLIETVKQFIYQSYLFIEKMDFDLIYESFKEDEETAVSSGINFISRQNTHLESYKKYDVSGGMSFSCSSFLISIKGIKLFYTGDIGGPADLNLFSGTKIDLMISEISHVKLTNLLDHYRRSRAGRLILTHVSDEDEESLNEFFSLITSEEKKSIETAFDGMTIRL